MFPAFFTVALATLVGAYFIYSPQVLASCGANLTAASLSVANLKYMLQGNYFTISPDAQPFLHYWSLSVEEQFYMFFPVLLYFVYLKANRYKTIILSWLCGTSLIACIALTHIEPAWAFFLLPTRAWELLAGSILAVIGGHYSPSGNRWKVLWASLSLIGMVVIAISLFVIGETAFPGYLAVFPVLGTICCIGPNNGPIGFSERLLSWKPMVLIGRMSYSLYLWHWPVFSLVDYRFYLSSSSDRIGLKVALSLAATVACFFLVETPGRVFLNHPSRRRIAFAFLGCALLFCIPLGIIVRRTNYVNADIEDIRDGGLVFNESGKKGAMVLMGDSNGSMYAKMFKQTAYELDLRLNVISVAGEDALPQTSGHQPQLWIDSLAVVKREKPDVLVLVCDWQAKLRGDNRRLEIAVNELRQSARHLILITQPPALPELASRESMRNGSRPPFREDPVKRAWRIEANSLVKNASADNVIVIDIERLFTSDDGMVRVDDNAGNQFYDDSNHLSDIGAHIVKRQVLSAIEDRMRF